MQTVWDRKDEDMGMSMEDFVYERETFKYVCLWCQED